MITINGLDSEVYGVTFLSGTLEALLKFPTMKEPITNSSRTQHGVQIYARNGRVESQRVQLPIRIQGSSESDYLDKYEALQNLLISGMNDSGMIELSYSKYTFRLRFESCDLLRKLAPNISTVNLTFLEPNPMNRL